MTEAEAIKPAWVNGAGLETSDLRRNIGKTNDLRFSFIYNLHFLALSPFPFLSVLLFRSFPPLVLAPLPTVARLTLD